MDLQRTADISDATEEMLEIAAVVDAALRPIAIRPVVVGGLAVAYWTTGLYLTADIDVVMPYSTEVEQRLASLGFEREGRFWTLPGRRPVLEAPGSTLEFNPDGHTEVELASGRTLRIQEVEEGVLLRLAELSQTATRTCSSSASGFSGSRESIASASERGPPMSRSPRPSMR